MVELSITELSTLAKSVTVLSVFSALGCTFMIVSTLVSSRFYSVRSLLILAISTSDLIGTILNLSCSCYYLIHKHVIPSGPSCSFIGGAISYFKISNAVFIACATVHMYLLVRHNRNLKAMKYGILYVGIGCIFPLIPVSFVAGLYSFEKSGIICWIAEKPTFVRLVFELGIALLVMILILVLDAITIVHIYKVSRNSARHTVHMKAMRRLAVYPLVFFLMWLPFFINRAQNAADPGQPSFGLFFFTSLTSPLQGALNAVVYGVNEKFIEMYRECLTGRRREGKSSSSSEGINPHKEEKQEVMEQSLNVVV